MEAMALPDPMRAVAVAAADLGEWAAAPVPGRAVTVAAAAVVSTFKPVTASGAMAVRLVLEANGGVVKAARVVVAGCSAALRAAEYRALPGVDAVVPGSDAAAVAAAVRPRPLVALELRSRLDRLDDEPIGAELLRERAGATRGWLKIQDGCDRHCSFCATRLARGASRSRAPDEIVREARLLARAHLFDPYFTNRAAVAEGVDPAWPPPYEVLRGYKPR